jgi:hypothetical protein
MQIYDLTCKRHSYYNPVYNTFDIYLSTQTKSEFDWLKAQIYYRRKSKVDKWQQEVKG